MTYQSRGTVTCLFCDRLAIARKLCRRHYYRVRDHGRLADFPILGPEDVFENRYEKTGGCWIWKGTLHSYGYGVFLMPGGKPVRAHRYAYERVHGAIPDGMIVMHSCDNPPCVNPAHLSLGTRDDNNQDKQRKGRHPHGDSHHWTKISDRQVQEIHGLLADGMSQVAIARRYGVDNSTISNIKTGKRRAC